MAVTADQLIETFESAQDENVSSTLRENQVVTLPETGEVWMTGDIHDHRSNFNKLIRAADLGNNPQRHLVLHELIHGDHFDPAGAEGQLDLAGASSRTKVRLSQPGPLPARQP